MVKKVGSNNRAMVEIRGKTYAWNVKALRLAAKSGTSISRMCACRAPTDHGLFAHATPHVRWFWMMQLYDVIDSASEEMLMMALKKAIGD